jgi:hypothetical protein
MIAIHGERVNTAMLWGKGRERERERERESKEEDIIRCWNQGKEKSMSGGVNGGYNYVSSAKMIDVFVFMK